MPTAILNGLNFHYERAGDGPPLLFISGTGSDLRVQPNVFASPLAKSFDLLAYDQRGLGRTDKPDAPYTMADYADDAAALMDHVGWDEALVVGVSFGGMVAQELVLRHPGKVKRLVLACTSPGGEGGAEVEFAEKMPGLTDELKVTADLGKSVTVARRKGADWYVASLSGPKAAAYPYPLSFLTPGRSYRATLFSDEPGGRKALRAQQSVNSQSVLTIAMEPNGGHLMIIEAVTP